MKPLNFFEYWNKQYVSSKLSRFVFYALFFYSILFTLAGIFTFIFVLIKHVSIYALLIGLISSAAMIVGFGSTLYFLFIEKYYLYRKNFNRINFMR